MARFKIAYRGCDGSETMSFSSLGQVARYLKGRDLGSCYRRPSGLQGEYAFFSFDGFAWSDLLDKSYTAHDAKYKPDLLAAIKLRAFEEKYDNRTYIARKWKMKDGPETVGHIEVLANPRDPANPFVPFLGQGYNKSGPAAAALEGAKAWIVAAYTAAEKTEPSTPAVEDGPDW